MRVRVKNLFLIGLINFKFIKERVKILFGLLFFFIKFILKYILFFSISSLKKIVYGSEKRMFYMCI